MEKYGVSKEELREDLINEEYTLMVKLSEHIGRHNKTAAEDDDAHRIESRLQSVRDKLLEIEIKKSREK